MNTKQEREKQIIDPNEFRKLDTEGKILEIAKNFGAPAGKDGNVVLEELLRRIESTTPVKRLRFATYLRAVAALLILLFGFYAVTTVFSQEKVVTGLSEQTELKLPDNSEVVLNADSKLTYSAKNFENARNLTLKGEAFFDVQKGGDFVINTPNGKIEILGTQLNVFSREDEFWVSCLKGKVKVSAGNDEQIILPGEIVEMNDHRLVKKVKIDIEHTTAWKQGTFYFEDRPLVSIFEAIERQFNVSVKFDGDRNRLITVTFSNSSLQEALDVICIPMDLKYEIKNNKVFISDEAF